MISFQNPKRNRGRPKRTRPPFYKVLAKKEGISEARAFENLQLGSYLEAYPQLAKFEKKSHAIEAMKRMKKVEAAFLRIYPELAAYRNTKSEPLRLHDDDKKTVWGIATELSRE